MNIFYEIKIAIEFELITTDLKDLDCVNKKNEIAIFIQKKLIKSRYKSFTADFSLFLPQIF